MLAELTDEDDDPPAGLVLVNELELMIELVDENEDDPAKLVLAENPEVLAEPINEYDDDPAELVAVAVLRLPAELLVADEEPAVFVTEFEVDPVLLVELLPGDELLSERLGVVDEPALTGRLPLEESELPVFVEGLMKELVIFVDELPVFVEELPMFESRLPVLV